MILPAAIFRQPAAASLRLILHLSPPAAAPGWRPDAPVAQRVGTARRLLFPWRSREEPQGGGDLANPAGSQRVRAACRITALSYRLCISVSHSAAIQFSPIFPTAANDNLPVDLRPRPARWPRPARQALRLMASEPTAFFLYLFAIGLVVTSTYSLAIAIALRPAKNLGAAATPASGPSASRRGPRHQD
jgi:hypothetical protein